MLLLIPVVHGSGSCGENEVSLMASNPCANTHGTEPCEKVEGVLSVECKVCRSLNPCVDCTYDELMEKLVNTCAPYVTTTTTNAGKKYSDSALAVLIFSAAVFTVFP